MLVPEIASPITCAMHSRFMSRDGDRTKLAQSDRIGRLPGQQPAEPPIAERDDDQLHQPDQRE
jgi:hypothetical protein